MKERDIITVPITDYFKLFLDRYRINKESDVYVSFVESIVTLAQTRRFAIYGMKREEEFRDMSVLFRDHRLPIRIDDEFVKMVDIISNEIINYLVINGKLDAVIYLSSSSNNYLVFNTYRL